VTAAEIAGDLRSRGVAEVDTSARRAAEYSGDASLYRVVPAAVVFPRSAEEIAITVQACREHGVPLTMRGGGTSLAGNAVGTGLVLDTSRHLHRVRSIDPGARVAIAEPGVVLDDLQRQAARHGLRFGPDPSSHSRCTIGGMIGNNACGSRALGYGRTSDSVLGLEVITGTGELIQARGPAGPGAPAPADQAPLAGPAAADGSATLAALQAAVRSYLPVIRTELGRFSRQVSGYALEHLLPERGFDVARALVGTEGTWAVTTLATLRLRPVPADTLLIVLGYPDMAAAGDAVPALLPIAPVAIEGFDARIVDLVRRGRGAAAVPELPSGQGWLLVELAGSDQADLAAAAAAVIAAAGTSDRAVVADKRQAAAIWRIREDGAGLVTRPGDGHSYHPGWEDAAVPPARLGRYLREFDALVSAHGLRGLPYGHFGDGCVHVRLDFPFAAPDGTATFRRFLLAAADLVAAHGGSMSGEHGDGRARGELLARMYSPAALAAFAAAKAVFDPDDVLNPGVVVRPRPVDADLRPPLLRPHRTGLGWRYPADGGDFASAAGRCTGIGTCRAAPPGGVMCPSYRATRDEKDTTRGRARVLQELVSGSLPGGWQAAELQESLDLCLSCKACSAECPTGTDMAAYKAEVLYQRYRGRLRPAAHYALGWLPRWARAAGYAPAAVNALLAAAPPALTGLAGIDPRRRLPRFARPTFRRWFGGHAPRTAGDPVVLWADTFTNYFTPEAGIAAVQVLEAAGYAVSLSRPGDCCGLTWISTGQLSTGRRKLARSVAHLAPHVRAGTPVVGLEPSCVAVFRGDARGLLGEAAATVGGSVRTLAELLAGRSGWQPPGHLRGRPVIAQPHCHQRAVMGWGTDQALLAAAGSAITPVGGCCGLAGNFGMERGHYEVSVAVAETALLPAVRHRGDDALILADGFSCRTQLDQLAGVRAYHLAEVLAGSCPAAPAGERHIPDLTK
jgi:FAD/FMN-containing dehydrogenase/Fe-S oxidoreductase